MVELGVGRSSAENLVSHSDPQAVRNWISLVTNDETIEDPPAYLAKALRENWQLPETFHRKHAEQEEAERQEQERQLRENCLVCQGRGVYQVDQNTVAICHHTGEKKTAPSTQNLDTEAVWSQTLQILRGKISGFVYETHLTNTKLLGIDGNTAIIQAPDQSTIQHLENLWGHIARALSDVLHEEVEIQFIPAQQKPPA